jgi:hypothetical protein
MSATDAGGDRHDGAIAPDGSTDGGSGGAAGAAGGTAGGGGGTAGAAGSGGAGTTGTGGTVSQDGGVDACEECKATCAGSRCDDFSGAAQAACKTVETCAMNCKVPTADGYTLDPVFCYCGLADTTACLSGGGNGYCRTEIEAAAGTTDPAQIMPLLSGNGPAGTGLALTRCGLSGSCPQLTTGCFHPTPPSPPTPGCGDGVLQPGEQCDPPNAPTCTSTCQFAGGNDGGIDGGTCANPSPSFVWNHQPASTLVNGVWSTGPGDTWMSTSNTLSHWNGNSWAVVTYAPSLQVFQSLWAAGPNDVWISGTQLWHWNGTTLTPIIASSVAKTFGTGPNDVWAVQYRDSTTSSRMYHWDGALWNERTPPLVQGKYPIIVEAGWGANPNDEWAFGVVASGFLPQSTLALMHWDGQAWTPTSTVDDPTMLGRGPMSVWGSSGHDIWALVANYGSNAQELWHYDGSAWTIAVVQPGGVGSPSGTVWGSSASDVWATIGGTVSHFDGSSWTPDAGSTGVVSFLTGEGGGVLWGIGSYTSLQDPPVPSLFHREHGCVTANNDGGTDGPPPSSAPIWTIEPGVPSLGGLWAVSASEVWRSGAFSLDRWDGTSWNTVLTAAPSGSDPVTTPYFGRIWASGSNDVWVAGGGLRHFDGSTWTARTPDPLPSVVGLELTGLWGFGPNDVWTIRRGSTGQIPYHWDGQAWTARPIPPVTIPGVSSTPSMSVIGVWGSGPSDVWAFGSLSYPSPDSTPTYTFSVVVAAFMHWNGQTWTFTGDPQDPQLTGHSLLTGWGTSSTNAWAVGEPTQGNGTDLWHFDGTAWSIVDSATPGLQTSLGAVWGSGPNDVWASGPGFLWHFDGASLSKVSFGAYEFTAGTSSSPDEAWAGGWYSGGAGALYHLHLP